MSDPDNTADASPEAVTEIRELWNLSAHEVHLQNFETPGDHRSANPGQHVQVTMCIPWCWSTGRYPGHHLKLDLVGLHAFYIWQHDESVRHTHNVDAFSPHAPGVPGASNVGGRRRLQVNADGSIEFSIIE